MESQWCEMDTEIERHLNISLKEGGKKADKSSNIKALMTGPILNEHKK